MRRTKLSSVKKVFNAAASHEYYLYFTVWAAVLGRVGASQGGGAPAVHLHPGLYCLPPPHHSRHPAQVTRDITRDT